MSEQRPLVSVIIPCRNGAATLIRQLDALAAQDCDGGFEVIVADNGSTDRTREIVDEYGKKDSRFATVDASLRPGINYARNAGARGSRGKLLLFCDCDDVVQKNWLGCHVAAFLHGADMTAGGVDRCGPDGRVVTSEDGLYSMLWDKPWGIGANFGTTRELFDAIGGFDEEFAGGGDETDFFWRAQLEGFELVGVPNARIFYMLRSSRRSIFRQSVGYGRSHVALYRRYADRGMPRAMVFSSAARTMAAVCTLLFSGGAGRIGHLAIAQLGVLAGRIAASWRYRTLYV